MALFAIGDLHLPLAAGKPMDIFSGWDGYVEKLESNWRRLVGPEDTVVLAGDISWAMGLEQSLKDFQFIQDLPGKKLLLKGNHDYWWTTKAKMDRFFEQNGLDSLSILHNNSAGIGRMAICGSRGWLFEQGEPHDQKILAREAARLEASLAAAEPGLEKVVFLHYPPVFGDEISAEIVDVLLKHQVKRCYYGHIHGAACRYALNGEYLGIRFQLISADFLGFCPIEIPENANK